MNKFWFEELITIKIHVVIILEVNIRRANSLSNGVGINMYSWNAHVVKEGQINGLKNLTTVKNHIVIIFE